MDTVEGTSQQQQAEEATTTGNNRRSLKSKPRKQGACRFYKTPTGCRAGGECRFVHDGILQGILQVSGTGEDVPAKKTKDSTDASPTIVPVTRSAKQASDPPSTSDRGSRRRRKVQEGRNPDDSSGKQSDSDAVAAEGMVATGSRRRPRKTKNSRANNIEAPAGADSLGEGLTSGKQGDCAAEIGDRTQKGSRPRGKGKSQVYADTGKAANGDPSQPATIINNDSPGATRRPQPALRVPISRPPVSRPQPRSLESRLQETTDPLDRARLTRELDLGKLERRFRESGYAVISTTPSEMVIAAALVPSDPDFPYELLGLELHITIPTTYPLTPTSIKVQSEEIPLHLRRNVEKAWTRKATASKLAVLQMVNWLDRELEGLLIESSEPATTITFVSPPKSGDAALPQPRQLSLGVPPPVVYKTVNSESQFVASDDDDEDASVAALEHELASSEPPLSTSSAPSQHKGTQIRLPTTRLDNISLLQCTSLNLVVRCTRCKQANDIANLTPATDTAASPRWLACTQCATTMGVKFRSDPLHPTSLSIGYLDLDMCSPFDLLPSNYIPTCGSCAVPQPHGHIFKSVIRGYPTTLTCITSGCHAKMTLAIDDVKFVKLQPTILHNVGLPLKKKKKPKDDFALVVGAPLPKNGICKHYKQSYRYFRFPCCGKLFPCDVCHDEEKENGPAPPHETAWATRVVCGFCSREFPYQATVSTCVCGKDMVREKHKGGFWEGGKGTRDRNRMNRNDPRKFAGLSKTTSQKSSRVGKKHDG
ncbi:hypothetical protein PhCBS80983_g03842 [Powellomyces hirtus]|uniref:CHY-type domain-containing protein n=1 Tax=Powellomyces hirtus TaxID=109895 RepID=A0A507E2B5_9FUNG|nr:hypothetical protein PhCBS80983_g03842 [Powellomyces hirtus]